MRNEGIGIHKTRIVIKQIGIESPSLPDTCRGDRGSTVDNKFSDPCSLIEYDTGLIHNTRVVGEKK